MPARKYTTRAAAIEALKKIGDLVGFGRMGEHNETSIYTLTLPDHRKYVLLISDDGLVSINEPGEPHVYKEQPKEEHLTKDQMVDIYKDGICGCKAAGRFRWVRVNGFKVFMCTVCKRPKYWTTSPPAIKKDFN